jgi:hypothetical protein
VKLRIGKWDYSRNGVNLPDSRYQHPIYVLGNAGTGKSTLLANLSLRLHALGEGVLVIDHKDGDLARSIAQRTSSDKLIFISPGDCFFDDIPHHWGLNVLEVTRRDRLGFARVQSNTMRMFERMERANFLIMQQMRLYLDAAIRLALYQQDATLLDVRKILTEREFRLRLTADPRVPDELREHFNRFDDPKQTTAYARNQAVNSSIPRLKEFLTDPQVSLMVTQPRSSIHLEEWLDNGYIVVCDFATGLTQTQSELLANLMLAIFLNAVFTRRVQDSSRIWRLVADEFDLLAGKNFAELIDKARSYKSIPVMANQSLSQLVFDNDTKLQKAVLRSPVKITLRVSEDDAKEATWIHSSDLREGLTSLPEYTAVLTLVAGLPGLLDRGQSELILLDPLQGEENEAALEAAIASQRSHTTAERLLRRGTMERHHDHQNTRQTNRSRPLDEASNRQAPGDDPTGLSDSELPVDFPSPEELAGVQAPLPGEGEPRRRNSHRTRRHPGHQPRPESPQKPRPGGGQAKRPAGQSPGQVGTESPHPRRPPRTDGVPDGPRPGDAAVPIRRRADLPDD